MEATIYDPKPFASKEHFQQYRAAFKKLAHAKQLTAKDMIIHNILRGRQADYGFSPITNPIKVSNGNQSKFIQVRWQIWNDLRRYYQNKTSNPKWAISYRDGLIVHYEEYEKIFTDQMWDHIYAVLQN